MIHPALRYLIRTRLRNRLLRWARGLRKPAGWVTLAFILLIGWSFTLSLGAGDDLPAGERRAVIVSILSFMLVLGILSSLGQRGLFFSAADLDFVFPAPIPRRDLLLYYFLRQYVGAVFFGLLYLFVLGGRHLPHPYLLYVGIVLCKVTISHLATCAATLSMVLADRMANRLRLVTRILITVGMLGGLALLVVGLSGAGHVPERLEGILDSGPARVLLYPANAAGDLGTLADAGPRLAALFGLVVCALGSFFLVLFVQVNFIESSFVASRKMHKARDRAQRGVGTVTVRASRGGRGTARLFRGAAAVFWLNLVTMRRQLRAVMGGVITIAVFLAIIGTRDMSGDGDYGLAGVVLIYLALLPMWMNLPVGMRLPPEQLTELKLLPVGGRQLVAALVLVPVLVSFVLQTIGVAAIAALGNVPAGLLLGALVAYPALGLTGVLVEGYLIVRAGGYRGPTFLQTLVRFLAQTISYLPLGITAGIAFVVLRNLGLALLTGAAAQYLLAWLLLGPVARQLQRRDLLHA